MSATEHKDPQDFWLFGYGSLIWKPPPHFGSTLAKSRFAEGSLKDTDQRVPGYIKGYVRRFWQASEDHRGTPEAPGRVVTLINRSFWESLNDPQRLTEGNRVWGVAYHIIPSKVREVKEYLDIREINGYSIQYTPFHPVGSFTTEMTCLVYIGMPDNPQFLGALEPNQLAKRINESVGPSGENREYLLQLEEALQHLSLESGDEHISDLARRVRAMTPPVRTSKEDQSFGTVLRKINSTEEQEEIEKET